MKENNVVQGILIFLIFVCITCFGIGYIRHKLSPTPVNPNNNSNNTNDVIEFAEPPEITIEEVRTNQYTLLFTSNNYEVYKNNNRNFYYALNIAENKLYFAKNGGVDGNPSDLYLITLKDSEAVYGVFTLENQYIISGYEDYSCQMHSDTQEYSCTKDTTIVKSGDKYGLISLKDGTLILEVIYDNITKLSNNNLLAKSSNGEVIYSSDGGQLISDTFNFIGYNENFGYITLLNNNLQLYDTNLTTQDVNNFETNFNNANQNNTNSILLSTSNSYHWSGGSVLVKANINEEFSNENINFKYSGTQYSGEHYIIIDKYSACYANPIVYVIEDGKADLINNKDIKIDKEKLNCF